MALNASQWYQRKPQQQQFHEEEHDQKEQRRRVKIQRTEPPLSSKLSAVFQARCIGVANVTSYT